ncbi:Pex19 family protein [Ancylostoma ceylanicum]|uniref:Peroxin-19 n=1 Tax=Ancylostoma ceylanicum TaxID=53326 RepID=A0A0D6LRV5_9BILA|nr:Pex19 family protein [Ancylostoma ceylanicum]
MAGVSSGKINHYDKMTDKGEGPSKKNVQDAEGLSELLDDALKGFADRPRTTDDELDEIMAEQDQAAAQKAAGDFQAMLQQMVKVQEEALKQAEDSGQQVGESEKEAKEMIEAMKALMESSGKTLASKAVMYPPLKEIHDNYPAFFKEHGASLDSDTRQRYEKQYEVLGKICHEFEKQPDEPAPSSQAANGDVPNFNSHESSDISNFENLGKLLVELQTYGYPPKELTGELPAGWAVDDTTGLPKVDDISAAANSCTIIVDRAYKRFACEDYDNIAYLHHPSGVCVLVLRQQLDSEVVEVDFGNTKKNGISRADHVVVGKGKKGGLHLQKETRICTIRCKDGKEIVVRAGVRGVLAEVNDRLFSNPDLVRTAPENQGYIALITFGAGKRTPDEFITELPAKRVFLNNYEENYEIEKKTEK